MKVFFAADHAGFHLKEALVPFVRDLPAPEWLRQAGELGYEVEDLGAHAHDPQDDYPTCVAPAARAVSQAPSEARAIIIGGSGQGEAMVANRFPHVRAAVFYGEPATKQTDADGNDLSLITSAREHNDANVLSLGARFLSEAQAKAAVREWLATPFSGAERHARRIASVDAFET